MAQPVIADDPLELVTPEDEFTVGLDDQGRVRISPTDVSQFIRLDQCELRAAPRSDFPVHSIERPHHVNETRSGAAVAQIGPA